MDKKTIILVVILAIVIIFYFPILKQLGVIEDPPQEKQAQTTQEADSLIDDTAHKDYTQQFSQEPETATTPESEEKTAIMAERIVDSTLGVDTIIVNTNKFSVTLVSNGGGPVSLFLKKYTYRDSNLIQMLPNAERATPEITFGGGSFSASAINYNSYLLPGTYDVDSEPLDVVYTYQPPGGGAIIKTYRFYPDRYAFDLFFEVDQTDQFGFERKYNIVWNTPLGVTEPNPETDYAAMEAVAMMAGSREKLDDFEDGRLNQVMPGYTTWAGVRAKYFAGVIIPRNRDADAAVASGFKAKINTPDGKVEQKKITAGLEMAFANVPVIADSFTVFVGPLDYSLMTDYDVNLEDMLDIGTTPFIGWLIKPFAIAIIWLLPKMYNIIPNYGLVIIIFALLIKLITWPLSMKSFRSMQAMKTVQPEIDKLKQQFKKNPQALNTETMKLYKKHGVNPLSGCLPILPQMPLFFALFSVFRSTILLRDAPFFWFISDLSRGAATFTDPYMILVIVMVAAQFISQKFTMASTQQNKSFMYIMPLFMGFIFYKFAAGLVLYWTCFSLFSLLDYVFFRKGKNTEVKAA